MHPIRLRRTGLEVREPVGLRVPREDADELSAIRDGATSFGELLEAATALQASIDQAAATTGLPGDVDHEAWMLF